MHQHNPDFGCIDERSESSVETLRFAQRHRPGFKTSRTLVMCSMDFADLADHDSKEIYVRRRPIKCDVPYEEGSYKEVLAVGDNGGGKISCCFFDDIVKFCSPLAHIPLIYYHSIGRKVTKTRSKICFEAPFSALVVSVVTMKRMNCLSVVATSLN